MALSLGTPTPIILDERRETVTLGTARSLRICLVGYLNLLMPGCKRFACVIVTKGVEDDIPSHFSHLTVSLLAQ